MSFDKLIQDWGGNLSCSRFDPETGTFFTIAVDSLSRGPAAGGTRAMVYPGFEAAIEDATRLASAMTLKMAIAGLPTNHRPPAKGALACHRSPMS